MHINISRKKYVANHMQGVFPSKKGHTSLFSGFKRIDIDKNAQPFKIHTRKLGYQ